MKGREGKGPPSADLLVCFPSRAHLTLMAPKPNVCSPSRPSEPNSRHRRRNHHPQQQAQHHHHMRNGSIRGGSGGGGHASPLLWAKTKYNNDISEPTSPKVTCAGQIKVRNKPNSCKSWQSVMEEIERLHNNRNKKKKHHAWAEALGFKKDVMQFLTCLRNIRFDFRCFGSFPSAAITSDDEDDEEEDDEETYHTNIEKESKDEVDESESSRTFSKWFMILQENNQSSEVMKPEGKRGKTIRAYFDEEKMQSDDNDNDDDEPCAPPPPPPNALLLMRCRSAPAKSWLEEKEEEEKSESSNDHEEKDKNEERRKTEETEKLHVVMRCGTDFSKFSSDIAKETWVVGGIKDMLSRSRSSRR